MGLATGIDSEIWKEVCVIITILSLGVIGEKIQHQLNPVVATLGASDLERAHVLLHPPMDGSIEAGALISYGNQPSLCLP